MVISVIDRIERVLSMAIGSALACARYTLFRRVDDPFQPVMVAAAPYVVMRAASLRRGR